MTDKSKIIDKLLAELPTYDPPGPNEFTINDLLSKHGWPNDSPHRQKADRLLRQMLADGMLTKRKGTENGKRANIYKRITP